MEASSRKEPGKKGAMNSQVRSAENTMEEPKRKLGEDWVGWWVGGWVRAGRKGGRCASPTADVIAHVQSTEAGATRKPPRTA
jgi:hypothetical protein